MVWGRFVGVVLLRARTALVLVIQWNDEGDPMNRCESRRGRGVVWQCAVALVAMWCAAAAHVRAAEVLPLADHVTVWRGQTQVIPFRVKEKAAGDQAVPAVSGTPGVLAVVRDGALLDGETLGYVRVRGVAEGEAVLKIGEASIRVVVRESSAMVGDGARLVIAGPVSGAAVWGRVTVGVELWDAEPIGISSSAVRLRVPGGKVLTPTATTPSAGRPWSEARFEFDATELPPGAASLSAFVDGDESRAVARCMVKLTVVHPAEGSVVQGECEATLDTPRVGTRGKGTAPRVGGSPQASGGRFVSCYSAEPAWLFPLEVKDAGQYQVMVRASGDAAAGALPSIGVVMGEGDRAVTASRLVDYRWHRVPVGRPVPLKAGSHVLSVRFLNDFSAPDYADRNLYLDSYEVVRVGGDAPAQPGDAMAMAPAMAGGAMSIMSGGNDDAGDLRVAFLRPMHGKPLRGDLLIEGTTWWRDADNTPMPTVSLVINGKQVQTQHAPDPRFRVNPGYFTAGVNSVQITATHADGTTASTPAQDITVDAAAIESSAPRRYLRFGIEDTAWGKSFEGKLNDNNRPDGHRVALLSSNARTTITLPDDLAGRYELFIEMRGDEFQGPAIASVYLQAGDTPEKPIKQQKANRWWDDTRIETIELPAGPKKIIVAFENDLAEDKKGDRNLYLKAMSLRTPAPEDDRVPPTVRIVRPMAEGTPISDADVIVAEASDNDALDWVDVVIDGRRQGMHADRDPALGRLVFPLLLRSMPPGSHTVKVRARDRAGNESESNEVTVVLGGASDSAPGAYERAVRLLDRFAYGPDPDELAAVLMMGEREYLVARMGGSLDDPGERAALGRGAVTWPVAGGEYEVGVRALQHAQLTPNPVRARFVFWAENHFSTWVRKTEGWRKWDEHRAFSRLGVAPFINLLETSATSPAMLVYLDQQRSFSGKLNENYAREIMELHTLGVHGGYTQKDVTALAGVLNGWTVTEESSLDGRGFPLTSVFRFEPTLNDGQVRRVIGVNIDGTDPTLRGDRVQLMLETLASHPGTSRHIAIQLAEHYVSAPAPADLVEDLTGVFLRTGGDMREMLLTIASHPAFWRATGERRLARPMDYALRVSRVTGSDDTWQIFEFLRSSGMGIFDCVTPNGYPEQDERYADSNAMLQRWRLAKTMEWRLCLLIPGSWRWTEGADRTKWMQNVVDIAAVRLTGRTLSTESNDAALRVLADAKGNMDRRMMDVAAFIGALPEASLR